MSIKRGEIYKADLDPVQGSEQGGIRPVLIIQNDVGNKYSPTTIVAIITSQRDKHRLPTHVTLNKNSGLRLLSHAALEQIRVIDKKRLKDRVGQIDAEDIREVERAIRTSFGLE